MENVSIPKIPPTPGSTVVHFSWGAILHYLYTNRITFGRLGSQSPVTAEDAASGKVGWPRAGSFYMAPSSPKSVYTLACTVGIQGASFHEHALTTARYRSVSYPFVASLSKISGRR